MNLKQYNEIGEYKEKQEEQKRKKDLIKSNILGYFFQVPAQL